MLTPITILPISVLVPCPRLPKSSNFGDWNTKILHSIVITVTMTGRNFKNCRQNT